MNLFYISYNRNHKFDWLLYTVTPPFFISRKIFIRIAGLLLIDACKGVPVTVLTNKFINFSVFKLEGNEQTWPFDSFYWHSFEYKLEISIFYGSTSLDHCKFDIVYSWPQKISLSSWIKSSIFFTLLTISSALP